jgi:mevalonate kinase
MRLRVPGNVLLAGEYMVLERGGLGFCLAVDEYVEVEAEPARESEFVGRMGGRTVVFTAEDGMSLFLSQLQQDCESELGKSIPRPPLRITVDSSAHYYPDGRKRGLGSSAAVSVALAALLLREHKAERKYLDRVFRVALSAHRRSQGGRGSGYDVAVSTFGAFGLFSGGPQPEYFRSAGRELPRMTLLRGPQPVSTVDAVLAYETWKLRNGEAARRFFEESNENVGAMAASTDAASFASGLDRAAELGRKLGESIGVSAAPEVAGGGMAAGIGLKALGAGNELVLAYSLGVLPGEALRAASGGVEWLEE